MGNLLRRRALSSGGDMVYLFQIANPVFDNEGTYILKPVNPPITSPNLTIKSGSYTYSNLGSFPASAIVELTIDSSSIKYSYGQGTYTLDYKGSPVQFSRPYAIVVYNVYQKLV